MSRIGKAPVEIPGGVEVSSQGGDLHVKGPKGSLTQTLDSRIQFAIADDGKSVSFTRQSDAPPVRALHGLYRALCQNMVDGVTKGYSRRIEVHGLGYQAVVQGKNLVLTVGFANTPTFPIPGGLEVVCPNNTTIDVSGIDKQLVGQFAASVRAVKPSEPYTGKGLRYAGEQVKRKSGKSMAGG